MNPYKNKKALLGMGAMLTLAIACSNSNFSGGAASSGSSNKNPGSRGPGNGNGDPGSSVPGGNSPNGASQSPNQPGGSGTAMDSASGGLQTTCASTQTYDPLSVQCNIPVNDPTGIWPNTNVWKPYVNAFVDKSASWISPLAQVMGEGNVKRCPMVATSEKLIYVSHFDVVTAGSYTLEVLDDNQGSARLWKKTDPSQEVLNLHVTSGGRQAVNLDIGRYSLVIDGSDEGVASAVAASIASSTGAVLKHTATDGSWCIFRVPASENVSTFVNNNAGCLPCLGRTGP